MLRAIAIKELRESGWIAALGGLLLFLSVLGEWGLHVDDTPPFLRWASSRNAAWIHAVPFHGEGWTTWVLAVGMIGGAVLGLWQTFGESVQGTWGFYLHRSMDKAALVLAKAGVGLAWLLLCLAVPLVIYAVWAAIPGTHASPFEWWMTGPVVRAWAFASVGHLAGFLCGLRPARWWVSRFFPALAVGLLWLTVVIEPWTAWPAWLAILVADGLLIASIIEVTRERDWG